MSKSCVKITCIKIDKPPNNEVVSLFLLILVRWWCYQIIAKVHLTDKYLTRLIGRWQADILIRMNEGDSWFKKSGEMINSFLFKGKCLSQEFYIGSNLEAIGLNTFDIARNEYGSVWNENSGTGFMIGNGTWINNFEILGEVGTFSHPIKKTIVQFISTTEFLNCYTYIKKIYLPASRSGFFEAAILTYTRIN